MLLELRLFNWKNAILVILSSTRFMIKRERTCNYFSYCIWMPISLLRTNILGFVPSMPNHLNLNYKNFNLHFSIMSIVFFTHHLNCAILVRLYFLAPAEIRSQLMVLTSVQDFLSLIIYNKDYIYFNSDFISFQINFFVLLTINNRGAGDQK